MIDIFGLTVAFALIILGTTSKNYWLSLLVGVLTVAIYPQTETALLMIAAFLVGVVWNFAAKDLTSNTYFVVVVLLVGAIVSVSLGVVLIAILFAVAMILVFLFGTTVRTTEKVVGKANDEWKDLKQSVEASKGQHPAGMKEVEGILTVTGGKAGEALTTNPKFRFASPKLGERLAQASKNLIDGFFRLFK